MRIPGPRVFCVDFEGCDEFVNIPLIDLRVVLLNDIGKHEVLH
jgi:hypothetical protein